MLCWSCSALWTDHDQNNHGTTLALHACCMTLLRWHHAAALSSAPSFPPPVLFTCLLPQTLALSS